MTNIVSLESTTDIAKTLIDFGAAFAHPITEHDGIPYIVLPNNYTSHDIEKLLASPVRKRAIVNTTDLASFINYVNRHKISDFESAIYSQTDAEKGQFDLCAVIDDHPMVPDSTKASWRSHRCMFGGKSSVEWQRWMYKNKQPFSQSDFATFLEDNLPDIAATEGMPTGADILAMALGFEANAEKRLRSKINLQSGGVRFEFVDDEDKDTRTRMDVFQRFTIGIPVFDGSTSAYPIEARLKYREKEGKVSFWYELIRPDRIFRAAVTDEMTRIKAETGLEVFIGTP